MMASSKGDPEAMKIRSATCTSPGKIRKRNEDSWLIIDEKHLYAVADGMGGRHGGEVASSLAMDALGDFFRSTDSSGVITWPYIDLGHRDLNASRLLSAVAMAHQRIRCATHERPKLDGMGTTTVAAHIANARLYLAHVGDSRCYRLRKGSMVQLTRDHSLSNLVRKDPAFEGLKEEDFGKISHILVRALGIKTFENAEIELSIKDLAPGDTLLLCTDGITNELIDEEISAILAAHDDPSGAARELVDAANAHGGRDNCTALVVRVDALSA